MNDMISNQELMLKGELVTTFDRYGHLGIGYFYKEKIYATSSYGLAVNLLEVEFPVVDWMPDGGQTYRQMNNQNGN